MVSSYSKLAMYYAMRPLLSLSCAVRFSISKTIQDTVKYQLQSCLLPLYSKCTFTNKLKICEQGTVYFINKIK